MSRLPTWDLAALGIEVGIEKQGNIKAELSCTQVEVEVNKLNLFLFTPSMNPLLD